MTSDRSAIRHLLRARIATATRPLAEHASGKSPRRRRRFVLLGIALSFGLILAAPSMFSNTLLVRTQLARAAAGHGLEFEVGSIQVGWFRRLRLSGVRVASDELTGEVRIEEITSDLRFKDLLFPNKKNFGEWVITGASLKATVDTESKNSDQNLFSLLGSDQAPPSGRIRIQGASIVLTEIVSGERWKIDRYRTEIDLSGQDLRAEYAGTLTDPTGNTGSFSGKLDAKVGPAVASLVEKASVQRNDPDLRESSLWQLEVRGRTLPLSLLSLIRGRETDAASTVPRVIAGDATGAIRFAEYPDGRVTTTFEQLDIANLRASTTLDRDDVWANRYAALTGKLTFSQDTIVASALHALTDFGTARITGSIFRNLTLKDAFQDPSNALALIHGSLSAQIDCAKLETALSKILPLSTGTTLESGLLSIETEALPSDTNSRRRFVLKTQDWRVRGMKRSESIEPVDIRAILTSDKSGFRAEEVFIGGRALKGIGSGDSQRGSVRFDFDLRALQETLRPFKGLSSTELSGSAQAEIAWDLSLNEKWSMTGSIDATNLKLGVPGRRPVVQQKLNARIDLQGDWSGHDLNSLSRADLSISGDELRLNAKLMQPVIKPTIDSSLPMRVGATGNIQSLTDLLGPFIPKEVHEVEGQLAMELEADMGIATGHLSKAQIEVMQPRVAFKTRGFRQNKLQVDFEGNWSWPSGNLDAKTLTMRGDSLTLGLRGRVGPQDLDCEVAWRGRLGQLARSFPEVADRITNSSLPDRPFRPASARNGPKRVPKRLLAGKCSGKLTLHRVAGIIEIGAFALAEELTVVEPKEPAEDRSASVQMAAPRSKLGSQVDVRLAKSTSLQPSPPPANDSHVVWNEPQIRLDSLATYDPATHQLAIGDMKIGCEWFSTALEGQAVWGADQAELSLTGQTKFRLPELSKHFSNVAGTPVRIDGTHESPVSIRLQHSIQGGTQAEVVGSLGWESGAIAGVHFGQATIPIRLTEKSIQISPSAIPAGDGHINVAAQVDYRPGPVTIRLQPGLIAESIHLTEEMTDSWLKYIAPPIQRVEKIHGTFSTEIDRATIVLGAPDETRVVGRILIDGIEMSLTPLMQQVIGTLESLKGLAKGEIYSHKTRQLITMPEQSIDFDLNVGFVHHKQILFDVGDSQIDCTGYVTLGGRLAIIARVPDNLLSISKTAASSSPNYTSLPISGTMRQPMINPSGFMNVATLIGNRTAFDTGEKLLREQVDESHDLIEDTQRLFESGKKLFESFESSGLFRDSQKHRKESPGQERQSKKSDDPNSAIR